MKNNSVSLNRIKALPKELASKIAAGEVVERPVSIVKELVENSIDAGSTNITVEIRKGGKEYIRISDNGGGIPKDQMRLAFTRYATSKISSEEDLENIVSLGFRGEALASVAAVARIELISKTVDCKLGAKIAIEGGEELYLQDAACEDGTTIVVKDLFYNLPARFKFLKPDNTESSLIADFLQKMALAYPDIKFRFINNGTILFSTLGKGSLYEAILTLYSPKTARSLVELDHTEDDMHIFGYVSGSEASRTNKKGQVFFVNGRVVKSKLLDLALEEAYYDKLFDGRHPVCYLFLELSPKNIDVNVHPSKTEIKFYNESIIKEFVSRAIRRALLKQNAAPDIAHLVKEDAEQSKQSKQSKQSECNSVSKSENSSEKLIEAPQFIVSDVSDALVNHKEENSSPLQALFNKKTNCDAFLSAERDDKLFKSLRENQQIDESSVQEIQETIKEIENKTSDDRIFRFSELKILSQLFTTYILTTDDKCLYIIDQHAAHERIMYEKLLNKFNSEPAASQLIITPILIHATAEQSTAENQWGRLLCEIGFVYEEFGPNEYIIKEIPASLKFEEAEAFVNSVLENDFDNPKSFQAKRDAIISASCKAAVKAGDKLSNEEIVKLFNDLDRCENPFSCPHGRPTFLRFSEYEIEKFFKRK